METFKTVIGAKRVNEYLKLGWKRVHVFSKPTEWSEDGSPANYDAAFVIVWDSPAEPQDPEKQPGWKDWVPEPVPAKP